MGLALVGLSRLVLIVPPPRDALEVVSMGTRVWSVVEARLIELRAEESHPACGFCIEGLPVGRARTTADRIRAALINSGLTPEMPSLTIRLFPTPDGGPTSELDLAVAVAVLAHMGRVRADVGWVLATGRLGLNGMVHAEKAERLASIVMRIT